MKSLLGLLLLCLTVSLAAAETALPDTKTLWRAYQQNKLDNAVEWENAIRKLNQQIKQQILSSDPTLGKLSRKHQGTQKELAIIENQLLASSELKNLRDKRDQLYREFNAISPNDKRENELENKNRELQKIDRQITQTIQTNPDYLAQCKKISEIRNAVTARANQLIADSALPVAKVFRDTRALAPDYFDSDNYLLTVKSDINTENPFTGMYDSITYERAKGQRVLGYPEYIITSLGRENPGASPEKLANYAAFLEIGFDFSLPDGKDKLYLEPGATSFDELYNAAAANRLKLQNETQTIRRLTAVSNQIPSPSLTKYYVLDLIANITTNKEARANRAKRAFQEIERYLLEGKAGSDNSPFLYNIYSHTCKDEDWPKLEDAIPTIPNLDPWLKQMIIGRSAIIKAWQNRGDGWGFTVSNEGSKGFHQELKRGQAALEEALRLKPDSPQPYTRMISIAMGNCSGSDEQIAIFKKLIALDPFNRYGYENISWGLLPRWGGSLELILQLGDTALDYPYYDTIIPAYGFDMMGHVAYYYPDYRWKNIYLRDGIIPKGDRLFAEAAKISQEADSVAFLLYHKALFEMATLRYDQAAQTVAELGGTKEFAHLFAQCNWRGLGTTKCYPRIPAADSFAPEYLILFTGQDKQLLRDMEKRYLAGEDVGAELIDYLQKSKLTSRQKDALITLYGRWCMDFSIDDYIGCDGKMTNPLQAAGIHGYPEVFKNMIQLGYDYMKYEVYPGQTAVLIAQQGTDPELLDILKEFGDPLNRTEPKYGRTPLHAAANQGNEIMVKKLIELELPLEATDKAGHSALQLAAAYYGVNVTLLLLESGANPDKQDPDGDTSLMFVMQQNGPQQIWEALIKRTKNINLANNQGQTALHYAGQYLKTPDAIRALLAAGADPSLKNNKSETAADLARQRGRADLAAILDGKQK